jgi:septum formation protein
LPFEVLVSAVDETALPGETADLLVTRLAQAKAETVARQRPEAVVIGSDQVAVLGNAIFGKPGTRERAVEQLTAMSGRSVTFLTALYVCGPEMTFGGGETVPTTVHFRVLEPAEIERYMDKELALNCAGSCQVEGLGISLLERIESTDPTALVGLPLIALRRLLARAGIAVP